MKRVAKSALVGGVLGALAVRGIVKLFQDDPNNKYLGDRSEASGPKDDYLVGGVIGSVLFGGAAITTLPFRRNKRP